MKKWIIFALLAIFTAGQATGASLIVSPKALSLLTEENVSASGYFRVIAPNGFEKQIRVEQIPEWLNVDPVEFTIGRSNTQQVKVSTIPGKLKPGQHNANISVVNVTENEVSDKAFLSVMLNILPEKTQLSAVPRSIDIKPGQTKTIVISNPTGTELECSLSSHAFWIQMYPEQFTIDANSSAIIWIKMTATHLPGGNYPSVVTCKSDLGALEIPVRTVISSGVEFNPDTISDSGTLTLTNKLKKTVFVYPTQTEGVEFDSKRLELNPNQSKILKVTFKGEKKPDYLSFQISSGLKLMHNIRVTR